MVEAVDDWGETPLSWDMALYSWLGQRVALCEQ